MAQGLRKVLTFHCYKEVDKKLSFYFIQDMKIHVLYSAAGDKQERA